MNKNPNRITDKQWVSCRMAWGSIRPQLSLFYASSKMRRLRNDRKNTQLNARSMPISARINNNRTLQTQMTRMTRSRSQMRTGSWSSIPLQRMSRLSCSKTIAKWWCIWITTTTMPCRISMHKVTPLRAVVSQAPTSNNNHYPWAANRIAASVPWFKSWNLRSSRRRWWQTKTTAQRMQKRAKTILQLRISRQISAQNASSWTADIVWLSIWLTFCPFFN